MARRAGGRTRAGRRDLGLRHDADEILAAVRSLWKTLIRNPHAEAEAAGVTGPQVTVMACVVTRGPLTLTELSRTLGMRHSSTSGIVDRLEVRGLLRRTADPTDGRRTSIEATDTVRQYVRELEEGPSGRLARALASATPVERAAILRGFRLLHELLSSEIRARHSR